MTVKELPVLIEGPDQMRVCIDEMSNVAQALQQINRRKATGAPPGDMPALSQFTIEILELLPEKQRNDAETVEQLSNQLEGILRSSPTIHISLAASPPTRLRNDITAWFRAQIHPLTLLAFHANPELAGGMVVRTPSRVHDFSFRSALLGKKDTFIGVMERV